MGSLGFVLFSVLLSASFTLAVLPVTFSVASYDLVLTLTATNSGNNTVTGKVTMKLECKTATNIITFYWGKYLTPTSPISTSFTVQKQNTATTTNVDFNVILNTDETLIINTTTTPGMDTFSVNDNVTVTAIFGITLNQDLKGLFVRQVPNGDNTTSVFITTSMKPTYARNVFPCFDELTFPATIALTLNHPMADWKSGASLPLTGTSSNSTTGITTDTYSSGTSVLTPSALSIFFSNMVNTTYNQSRNTSKLYFWYPKDYLNTTLQNTMNFLANYYYGVEDLLTMFFPLANGLNIILVPGLAEPYAGYSFIFIRNDTYARDYSTPQAEGLFKMNVVPVLDQFLKQFTEFSTRPSLWSDSWMSDAFAGYLQYILLQSIGTPFDIRTDLEVISRQLALQQEASQLTALPLQDTLFESSSSSTSMLEALFMSPLRKLKGPFLLAMLDMSLPAGAVFTAIKTVLKSYQQSTLTSEQFYAQISTSIALSNAYISADTRKAIDNLPVWFKSSGYPLLNVTHVTVGSPGSVSFLLDSMNLNSVLPTYYVAATVGSRSDPRFYNIRQDIWVNTTAETLAYLNVAFGDWIATNVHSSGYYRTQYSKANWLLVGDALVRADDEIIGRTQLIDDAFTLSFNDFLDFNTTMRLATANMHETKFRNWFPVDKGLQQVRDHLLGLSLYTTYRNFMIGFLNDINSLLSSSLINDPFEKTRISSLFLDEMCEFNVAGYRNAALGNLTALLQGTLPTNAPSSSYEKLVCCGAQYSSSLIAQDLWNNIKDATASYYRKHFSAIALGCLSNYSQIYALNSTVLDIQNIPLKPYVMTVYQYVAEVHPVDFLADIPKLFNKLLNQLGAPAVSYLIWNVGQKINNKTQASVLNGLATDNTNEIVKIAANATITFINRRVDWLVNNNMSLKSAIEGHTQYTSNAASAPVPFSLFFFPCVMLFTTVLKMECIL